MQRDPLLDFSGQVALVTGAASGLGRALSEALALRGARLVASDIDEAGLDALAADLTAAGAEVVTEVADVSSEATAERLVAVAVERFGSLELAVNNAGIGHPFTAFEDITEAMFDRQIAVNVRSVLFGMKYQLRQMTGQGRGTILNVSSMAGLNGAPKIGAYAAAKHAVVGMTRTAAVEHARTGLRINAICPYYTHTPLVDNAVLVPGGDTADAHALLESGCPMRRLGQPSEIIAVMLMLLSPGNTFMTGQAIAVDGGVSAL